MSLQERRTDRDLFSSAWLATVKDHLRVEFDDDDTYLRGAILRAAAEIETIAGRDLVPREYVWRPSRSAWWPASLLAQHIPNWSDYVPSPTWPAWAQGAWLLPTQVGVIRRFRAVINGEDRSPAWKVIGNVSPGMLGDSWLCPAGVTASSTGWTMPSDPQTDWTFYLRSGFSTVDEMPDAISDKLLRLTGHLYENREVMTGVSMRIDKQFSDGLMSGLWLPRC